MAPIYAQLTLFGSKRSGGTSGEPPSRGSSVQTPGHQVQGPVPIPAPKTTETTPPAVAPAKKKNFDKAFLASHISYVFSKYADFAKGLDFFSLVCNEQLFTNSEIFIKPTTTNRVFQAAVHVKAPTMADLKDHQLRAMARALKSTPQAAPAGGTVAQAQIQGAARDRGLFAKLTDGGVHEMPVLKLGASRASFQMPVPLRGHSKLEIGELVNIAAGFLPSTMKDFEHMYATWKATAVGIPEGFYAGCFACTYVAGGDSSGGVWSKGQCRVDINKPGGGLLDAWRKHIAKSRHKDQVKAWNDNKQNINSDKDIQLQAANLTPKDVQVTANLFKIVYFHAYNRNYLNTLGPTLDAVASVGGKVGDNLRSRGTHTKIISFIAGDLREKFKTAFKKSPTPFSLIIDESQDAAGTSCMVVLMKTKLDEAPFEGVIGLVPLTRQDAGGLKRALKGVLRNYDIDEAVIKSRMSALSTDGAAVLTGKYNGMIAQFREEFGEKIQAVRCQSHLLELAVKAALMDALSVGAGLADFIKIMNDVINLFNSSSVLRDALDDIKKQRNIKVKKLTRLCTTRWTPATLKAAVNLWNSLEAIIILFHNIASGDQVVSAKDKVQELLLTIGSVEFVSALAFLIDVITPIATASLRLQRRSTGLLDSHEAFGDCVNTLLFELDVRNETRVGFDAPDADGVDTRLRPIQLQIQADRQFGSVKLVRNPNIAEVDETAVLKHIISRINARREDGGLGEEYVEQLRFVSEAYVLRSTNVLDDWVKISEALRALSERYPDHAFNLADALADVRRVRERRGVYKSFSKLGGLLQLNTFTWTMAPTTSSAERSFSQVNMTHTDQRWDLTVAHTEDVMLFRGLGPKPGLYDGTSHALKWLKEKNQSAAVKRARKPVEESEDLEEHLKLMEALDITIGV